MGRVVPLFTCAFCSVFFPVWALGITITELKWCGLIRKDGIVTLRGITLIQFMWSFLWQVSGVWVLISLPDEPMLPKLVCTRNFRNYWCLCSTHWTSEWWFWCAHKFVHHLLGPMIWARHLSLQSPSESKWMSFHGARDTAQVTSYPRQSLPSRYKAKRAHSERGRSVSLSNYALITNVSKLSEKKLIIKGEGKSKLYTGYLCVAT